MENKRGALIGVGVVVLLALVAAVVWFGVLGGDDSDAGPTGSDDRAATELADSFAAAWTSGQLASVPVTEASGDVNARSFAVTAGLGPAAGAKPTAVEVTGIVDGPPPPPPGSGTTAAADPTTAADPDDAVVRKTAELEVTWTLDAGRTWTYDTQVGLVQVPGAEGEEPEWFVDWTPSVVHPRLVDGDALKAEHLTATRGEILGPDGKPLVGLRPVVEVGIQPGATTDRTAAAEQVASLVGVDGAALVDRVTKAGADDFVSVVTLRKEVYDPISGQLKAIAGTTFREAELPLAPTRDFARALIGTTGPATAEIAAASGGRILEGEQTGISGLQAAQDEVLAGQAGISVRVAPAEGSGVAPYVLKDLPAVAGEPVQITIDPAIQAAADQVMASAPKPGALVAIRASTGDVLAVANGPAGADGYNRALIGKYPPGSTFKVASGLALLENGLTPETIVDCPATIVVGKEFRNAEGEVLGSVPFSQDFAESCNTAFVGQSREIDAQQLADTAAKLGYRKLDIGVPLVAASVPVTDSETEHAADMIGQGKVEASPFHVALASASVAAGRSVNPRLIIDPAKPEPVLGDELPAGPIAALRGLMRGVVTNGTGSALAGVPGGEVAGKTGTAEFGTEVPPKSHAWFTGYQGDIAFAVLVEDGGFGGQVAAPLAAQFLTALAG